VQTVGFFCAPSANFTQNSKLGCPALPPKAAAVVEPVETTMREEVLSRLRQIFTQNSKLGCPALPPKAAAVVEPVETTMREEVLSGHAFGKFKCRV
jgi:hypothetical protein